MVKHLLDDFPVEQFRFIKYWICAQSHSFAVRVEITVHGVEINWLSGKKKRYQAQWPANKIMSTVFADIKVPIATGSFKKKSASINNGNLLSFLLRCGTRPYETMFLFPDFLGNISPYLFFIWLGLVCLFGLYGISNSVGYLIPNPFYTNKQFYFKQFGSA